MKKLLALILALVMVLSFAACGESEEPANEGNNDVEGEALTAENIKIGFIHVSDPSDMGYTYNHDLGTKKMMENLGLSDDQVINKYNIGEDEGCATAINELI